MILDIDISTAKKFVKSARLVRIVLTNATPLVMVVTMLMDCVRQVVLMVGREHTVMKPYPKIMKMMKHQ